MTTTGPRMRPTSASRAAIASKSWQSSRLVDRAPRRRRSGRSGRPRPGTGREPRRPRNRIRPPPEPRGPGRPSPGRAGPDRPGRRTAPAAPVPPETAGPPTARGPAGSSRRPPRPRPARHPGSPTAAPVTAARRTASSRSRPTSGTSPWDPTTTEVSHPPAGTTWLSGHPVGSAGSRAGVDLLGEVLLDADLADGVQLALEEVRVPLLVKDHLLEDRRGPVVAQVVALLGSRR